MTKLNFLLADITAFFLIIRSTNSAILLVFLLFLVPCILYNSLFHKSFWDFGTRFTDFPIQFIPNLLYWVQIGGQCVSFDSSLCSKCCEWSLQTLAVRLGSLSRVKIKFWPVNRLNGTARSRKIDKYCSFFRIASIFIKSPTLFAPINPQIITAVRV